MINKNKQLPKWKPDNLMQVGLILNIVFGAISLFSTFFWKFDLWTYIPGLRWLTIPLSITSIILSSLVLAKVLKNNILPGIFGIFGSWIVGGILILIGKFEEETSSEKEFPGSVASHNVEVGQSPILETENSPFVHDTAISEMVSNNEDSDAQAISSKEQHDEIIIDVDSSDDEGDHQNDRKAVNKTSSV